MAFPVSWFLPIKNQDCQHTTSDPVLQIFPACWEVVNMMREKNCPWEIFNLILWT